MDTQLPIPDSSSKIQEQTCTRCKISQPITEYYVWKGDTRFKICKTCGKARRPKKPKALGGFEKLSVEIRDAVKTDLDNFKMTKTALAKKHGINLSNLVYWIRAGKFNP